MTQVFLTILTLSLIVQVPDLVLAPDNLCIPWCVQACHQNVGGGWEESMLTLTAVTMHTPCGNQESFAFSCYLFIISCMSKHFYGLLSCSKSICTKWIMEQPSQLLCISCTVTAQQLGAAQYTRRVCIGRSSSKGYVVTEFYLWEALRSRV